MVYLPSPDDWLRFERICGLVTPTAARWSQYSAEVAALLESDSAVSRQLHAGPVRLDLSQVKLRSSVLFGHQYPIVEVDASCYLLAFAHRDAVAIDARSIIPGASLPPMVLVPARAAGSDPQLSYESIIEHECVHVNQMVIGSHPCSEKATSVVSALQCFVDTSRCEYEANVLQLTRWPDLFPQHEGISLDHWCTLRGYSQALEGLVHQIFSIGMTARAIRQLASVLSHHVDRLLIQAGCDAGLAPWFHSRATGHIALATKTIISGSPEFARKRVYRTLIGVLNQRHIPEADGTLLAKIDRFSQAPPF